MKITGTLAAAVLIAAAITGGYLVWREPPSASSSTASSTQAGSPPRVSESRALPSARPPEPPVHDQRPLQNQVHATNDREGDESELATTAAGELVIDQHTRTIVETLSNVADVAELYDVQNHIKETLPPVAAARAADLIERYYRYRVALQERTQPNDVAALPQDAAIALDRLHALRTEFFGTELAEQWFGEEVAIGRETIADEVR